MNKPDEIKKIVKNSYAAIAKTGGGCSCKNKALSSSIGYSMEDIDSIPEANLGLGCGNPTAINSINLGETVVDLGSGAGFDAFIAARKVGAEGKVIGVDMTDEMIKKAQGIAEKYNYSNVEFRLGDIEELPVEDNSIDVVISNCVINLAPNKDKVFAEAHRVLKNGGRLYVSDIVLLQPLSSEQLQNEQLLAGCVAGAILKDAYFDKIKQAGFKIESIKENTEISKQQYQGIALESVSVFAVK